MTITKQELETLKQILKEEKESNKKIIISKSISFQKKYLLTEENNLFLTLDSVIEVNNIILNKNNLSLRKCQVKPAGFEFEYMHFNEISQLQILIDKYNDRLVSK